MRTRVGKSGRKLFKMPAKIWLTQRDFIWALVVLYSPWISDENGWVDKTRNAALLPVFSRWSTIWHVFPYFRLTWWTWRDINWACGIDFSVATVCHSDYLGRTVVSPKNVDHLTHNRSSSRFLRKCHNGAYPVVGLNMLSRIPLFNFLI